MTGFASPFWKHVTTVLMGSVAAQITPLLMAPLITRICTPEDMGAFGVWFGLIAIASIAATLRLEAAMILDHGTEEQSTCFSVVGYFATLLALALTLCGSLARAFDVPLVSHMSWFGLMSIGVGTWLTAYMQTTLAYAASCNAFAPAAKARVFAAATIAIAQAALLILGAGANALFAGQIIGLAAGLLAATYLLSPPRPRLTALPIDAQWNYLRKHKAFWCFALPAHLLNALCAQLPLLFISARHGVLSAGLFALTLRVLAAPVSLLAASILEVFKRQSVVEFQTVGNCTRCYLSTFRILALLGIGPALILLLFAPTLFAFVFGQSWRAAGDIARILAPLYFLNFIASPLSYVFSVTGKQKADLVWQVARGILIIGAFSAHLTLQGNLLVYTIGYSLLYLIYLQMSYRYAQNRQHHDTLNARARRPRPACPGSLRGGVRAYRCRSGPAAAPRRPSARRSRALPATRCRTARSRRSRRQGCRPAWSRPQ
jgi:O-antigen/teichoic acid export membrane protein